MEAFAGDRYLVDQLVRPSANLFRVTPLGAGTSPNGSPVAYVSETKPEDGEDICFYADEQETENLFQIKARNVLDLGGSRCDVYAGERQIGALEHQHRSSQLRSTWSIRDASNQELAVARERSVLLAMLHRLPGIGSLSAIPTNFDLRIDGKVVGKLDGKLPLRDRVVLDVSGDHEHRLDRRLAVALVIGLDALQN